ncbi:MAG: hypothetical protein JJE19_01590 [Methanosarcinales archaeon]|nr:hypothetical protein [Methanosarcinales archaeon]
MAKMQPQTKIYSIDRNPYAYEYMNENVALNKVEERVMPILGDASEEVEMLEGVADRVLMPLPEQAHAFLSSAVRALRMCKEGAEGGARGVIHYYDVSTGRKDGGLFNIPFERAQNIIASAFGNSLLYE